MVPAHDVSEKTMPSRDAPSRATRPLTLMKQLFCLPTHLQLRGFLPLDGDAYVSRVSVAVLYPTRLAAF